MCINSKECCRRVDENDSTKWVDIIKMLCSIALNQSERLLGEIPNIWADYQAIYIGTYMSNATDMTK